MGGDYQATDAFLIELIQGPKSLDRDSCSLKTDVIRNTERHVGCV